MTHHVAFLPRADHVIAMDQGKVAAQGSYEELVAQGVVAEVHVDEEEEAERQSGRKADRAALAPKEQNEQVVPARR